MSHSPNRDSYTIRYRQRAKDEAQRAFYLGASFTDAFNASIEEIAEIAAKNGPSNSVDYLSVLEELIEIFKAGESSTYYWKKWEDSSLLEKANALLTLVRRQRIPWIIRSEIRWIHNILGAFDAEIQFFYEIDHVNRQVVFIKFSGLPGQVDDAEC